jgi:hypothetical protein
VQVAEGQRGSQLAEAMATGSPSPVLRPAARGAERADASGEGERMTHVSERTKDEQLLSLETTEPNVVNRRARCPQCFDF